MINNIAVFISDHGLGHLTRLAPVINELYRTFPNAIFHLITSVNQFFIRERLQEIPEKQMRILNIKISVGVSEEDNSVSTSPCRTIERWRAHWKQHFKSIYGIALEEHNDSDSVDKSNSMVYMIEEFLKPFPIQLIVWDVPEIAPVIAKRLSEKDDSNIWPISIGISNWCWEWIYDHCMDHLPDGSNSDDIIGSIDGKPVTYKEVKFEKENMVKQSRSLYTIFGKTDLFIQLPYPTNDLPFNEQTVVKSLGNKWPITETVKKARHSREDMKKWVLSKTKLKETSSPSNYKFMMYSFGGLSFPSSNLIQEKEPTWNVPDDWVVIVMCSSKVENSQVPPNVVNLTFLDLGEEIDFARDLLLAVDVLVGKTSYGTVTECLYHKIPTLYMERHGMIEHGFTETALIENLGRSCCGKVDGEEVTNALPSLFEKATNAMANLGKEQVREDLDFTGGQYAVEIICSFLEENTQ